MPPGRENPDFWLALVLLFAPVILEGYARHRQLRAACEQIEQAAYDREFWDLVGQAS